MARRQRRKNPSGAGGLVTALIVGGIAYLAYRKWRGLGNGDYGITKPIASKPKPRTTTPAPIRAQPSGPSWWQQTAAKTYMPVQPYPQAGTQAPVSATQGPTTLPSLTKPTVVNPQYGIYEPGQFDITGQPTVVSIPQTQTGVRGVLTTKPGTLEPMVREAKKSETLQELRERPYAETPSNPLSDPYTFSYNERRAVLTDIAERMPSGVDRDMKLSLASKWADMADEASKLEVQNMPPAQKEEHMSRIAEGIFEPMDQFSKADISPDFARDEKTGKKGYNPWNVNSLYDQYNTGAVRERETKIRKEAQERRGESGWLPPGPTGVTWPSESTSDVVLEGTFKGIENLKAQADIVSGKANRQKIIDQASGKTKKDIELRIKQLETNSPLSMSGEERDLRRIVTGRPIDPTDPDDIAATEWAVRNRSQPHFENALQRLAEIEANKRQEADKMRSWLPSFR